MEIDREFFFSPPRQRDGSTRLLYYFFIAIISMFSAFSKFYRKTLQRYNQFLTPANFSATFLFILTNPAEPSDNFKRFNLSAPPLRGVLLKSECKGRLFTRNLQILPIILTQI